MSLRKDLLVTFLFIVVAPFCVFIHFAPLGDFWEFFISCAAVVVCSLFVLGWAGFKEKSLVVSSFVGCLFIYFAVLCLLTTLQQTHLADKVTLIIYSLVVLLTSLLALRLAQDNTIGYYDYLAFMLFVGGVIESMGAIAIQYRLAGIDYWMVPMSDRLIGFVAQSNQLAIYVMVSFLALGYLTLRGIFHVVLLVLFSLLFGFVLLGSGSRAVLIYLLAVLLVTIFSSYKTKDKSYLKFVVGLVALIIGTVIYHYLPIIMQLFSVNSSTLVESAVALSRSTSSDSFRLSEIAKTFVMLKESPLVGVGFGNYAVNSFWLGVNDPNYTVIGDLTLHSHNIFAQIMAEFGLIGLLALLALLGYIAYCFWKKPKTLQWWLVLSVFAVYFINSLLEYVMWRMHFVPLLLLMLTPLLSNGFKVVYPRVLNVFATVIFAALFIVMANSSLNAYAKSFFYNGDLIALDKGDYEIFKSATSNLVWGREIQMQEFSSLKPVIADLAYQQQITDAALAWRPYAPVLVNKIQLSLLTGQIGYLDKYVNALARSYPTMLPSICSYFKNFNTLPNLQGLRIVQKELNCRALLSPAQ